MRMASRRLISVPVLVLLAFGIALSGCKTVAAPESGGPGVVYTALPPDREAEATVMAHIDAPISFEAPTSARFEMSFANVHRCHGRDFVTFRVVNDGDYDFLWGTEWLIWWWNDPESTMDAMSQFNVEKPFMPDPHSCPSPGGDSGLLAPGETAYVGVYLAFGFDEDELAYFGDRCWEDILKLVFYLELSTYSYPMWADPQARPQTVDITFVIEAMPDRSCEEPSSPGDVPPVFTPRPLGTRRPGITPEPTLPPLPPPK
ncbi:MAG: hypothetical protein PVJ07_05940 [Anaerolineales bacterium]